MMHFPDTEICKRTVEEFDKIMQKNGTNITQQCQRLGLERKAYNNYKNHVFAPSAFVLQGLALEGADVHYILTGRRGH